MGHVQETDLFCYFLNKFKIQTHYFNLCVTGTVVSAEDEKMIPQSIL